MWGVDILLSALGLLAALAAMEHRISVILVVPLIVLLAMFARERQQRIDNALQLSDAYRGTTMVLADIVEADDAYTGVHSRTVVALSLEVAGELGLDARQQRLTEFGALLHDVGKIAVPKEIINKPGPLTPAEWDLVKVHTVDGERILSRVGGFLAEVGKVVRSSHERFDGQGYPDGLKGEEIPIEARIVSCCDALQRDDHRPPLPLGATDAVGSRRAAGGRRDAVRPGRRGRRDPLDGGPARAATGSISRAGRRPRRSSPRLAARRAPRPSRRRRR